MAENGAKNTKGHPQRLGERPGTDFPSVPPEETNPAALISEPRENEFPSFYAPKSVICYSGHGKFVHPPKTKGAL